MCVCVCRTCVWCCSLLAFLPAEARRHAPQVLPASPQSGATDVRMAGACRRLLLVSPLHAGFWSSISWLCNLFLVGRGDEGMCALLCAFKRRGGMTSWGLTFGSTLKRANFWLYAKQCKWTFSRFKLAWMSHLGNPELNMSKMSILKWKKIFDFDDNTSEQPSSPCLCLWFSPVSCIVQQQGRTITFGAQRGGGWWAVELQLSHGAFLLSFQYNFD